MNWNCVQKRSQKYLNFHAQNVPKGLTNQLKPKNQWHKNHSWKFTFQYQIWVFLTTYHFTFMSSFIICFLFENNTYFAVSSYRSLASAWVTLSLILRTTGWWYSVCTGSSALCCNVGTTGGKTSRENKNKDQLMSLTDQHTSCENQSKKSHFSFEFSR